MRILVVTATYRPSINGVAITLVAQKKELERRGHIVTVLAPKHANQFPEKGVIRLPSLPNPKYPDYPILMPIPTIHNLKILKEKFDLIYFHHPFYIADLAINLTKYFQCPSVFFYHSRYELFSKHHLSKFIPSSLIKYIILKNVRHIASKTKEIIVETNSIKQVLKKQGIKTQIEVVPTFIRPMRLINFDKYNFRKHLGINKDQIVILCVARLSGEKNLYTLLKAVKMLQTNKSFSLFIIGSGPEEKKLKEYSEKLGIENKVHFYGAVVHEELPKFYNIADIFAYPCKVDTQGLVILEAMSAKLPVVAFNSPGPKDFIFNEQSGFLVSSKDEFTGKLKLLVDSEKLRKQIGNKAFKQSQTYSQANSILKLEKLFRSLHV